VSDHEEKAMTRTLLSTLLVVGASLLASQNGLVAAEKKAAADKPNIIFILADDLGLDGVGCCGSDTYKKQTPNIDALARTGTRFEACYASPLCGPSRCLLLTGRYAFRTGGLGNGSWRPGGPGPKSKDEYPIARLLKENGYATCQTGKWRQVGETPKNWGFDEYCTDDTPSGWYWQKSYIKNGRTVNTDKEVYCPDIVHGFAIDFINRHKDQPFFVYYASHLVHLPMERTPDSKPGTTGEKNLYPDNIAHLDKQVGLIVKELERLHLREKTLIVFSADNGTQGPRGGKNYSFPTSVNGRAISGHKGQMLEGGSRVPLIANWPGVTPPGRVLKDLIDFSDMYPTFAAIAGAKMPKGLPFDGRSYAPQLRGQTGKPREWVYVQLGDKWYVRSPGWKLTHSGDLFEMKDAPFVEKPVAADSMDAEARAAREKLQKVLDALNPAGGKVNKP
jgi:arylsulfatase A